MIESFSGSFGVNISQFMSSFCNLSWFAAQAHLNAVVGPPMKWISHAQDSEIIMGYVQL